MDDSLIFLIGQNPKGVYVCVDGSEGEVQEGKILMKRGEPPRTSLHWVNNPLDVRVNAIIEVHMMQPLYVIGSLTNTILTNLSLEAYVLVPPTPSHTHF